MADGRHPLFIHQPPDRQGEYFNLSGNYLFTVQEFDSNSQTVHHAMTAPGFFSAQSGILTNLYRPDVRPLHTHDSLELMYVIRGELTQFIEDYCRTYTEGECCILNKNVRHVESFSSDFEAVFLLFSDSFLHTVIEGDIRFSHNLSRQQSTNELYRCLQQMLTDSSLFQKEMLDLSPVRSPHTLCKETEALFSHIIWETRNQSPGYYPMVCGYFARLFSLLSSEGSYRINRVRLKNSNEDFIFNQICLYLQQHHGRVNYEELETLLHYTRDYLNRIVKRRTGVTLTEFGHGVCLDEAAAMLCDSKKSITEIMRELGYSNRTYFYRIFEERFGTTPHAYRTKLP